MMSKRVKRLFSMVIVICLLLCACETQNVEPKPMVENIINDNYKISFETENCEYVKSKLNKDRPFEYVATIEYVGDEPAINVYFASNIVHIYVYNENNELLSSYGIDDVLVARKLEKNTPFLTQWTGDGESETLNNYEKGNYVLKAKFKFSRNENMTNLEEYTLELPLTIK